MLCFFGWRGLVQVTPGCDPVLHMGLRALAELVRVRQSFGVRIKSPLCPVQVEGRGLGRRAGWSLF